MSGPARRSSAHLWLLLAHAVLVQVISYALRPAISYAILDQGHPSAWLGVATAAFAVPPLVLALPSGRLVDRIGERTTLIIGSASFVLAAVAAITAGHTLAGLIASTAMLGLGVLFSVVGEQAWVMRDASAGRLDFAFGLYTFATSSGQMLGPLLLVLPPAHGSSTPPFAVIALAVLGCAIACLVLSCLIPSLQQRSRTRAPAAAASTMSLLRRPGVVPALVTSSLVLSSLDIALAYLPLLAHERGLATVWISVMLVVRGLATMLSRISLSRLTAWLGRRRVLVIGGWMSAASLALLAVPAHPLVSTALLAVFGLAAGTVQPLTMSWITLVTPVRERGVAASLRLVGNRAGQTLIPLAVAGLSALGGAALVFGATGASLIASAWMSRWAPDGDDGVGDGVDAVPPIVPPE